MKVAIIIARENRTVEEGNQQLSAGCNQSFHCTKRKHKIIMLCGQGQAVSIKSLDLVGPSRRAAYEGA